MSAYRHRQPIWSWSSVVLLSTLLLSPVAATTLLRAALSQTLPHNLAALAVPTDADGKAAPTRTDSGTLPRRASDEEEALRRAAARAGQLRAVRLDDDPYHPDQPTTPDHALVVALIAPARAAVSVPDTALTPAAAPTRALGDAPLPTGHAARTSSPRAPPAAQS
jgi:hypothetical protein